jgi:hypothetical protein
LYIRQLQRFKFWLLISGETGGSKNRQFFLIRLALTTPADLTSRADLTFPVIIKNTE